jgi:hypothetical protein
MNEKLKFLLWQKTIRSFSSKPNISNQVQKNGVQGYDPYERSTHTMTSSFLQCITSICARQIFLKKSHTVLCTQLSNHHWRRLGKWLKSTLNKDNMCC